MFIDNKFLLMVCLTSVITLITTLCIIPLAVKIGLVDKPGGRKKHHGNIPLIGGISIYIVLCVIAISSSYLNFFSQIVLVVSSILIIVGLVDDLIDIRPIFKLYAQVLAALLVMGLTGIHIEEIAYLQNGKVISFFEFGYLITIIAVVGLINAFNMMDGIDGLASIQAIISIIFLFVSSFLLNFKMSNDVFLVLLFSCLVGFLFLNLNLIPKSKVFLGDAGSMFLGFCVAWTIINNTQINDGEALPPSIALWLVAVPITDTITISLRRMLLNRSPFSPDRKHLHHICIRLGLSSSKTLILISTISVLSYIIGLSIYFLFGEIASIFVFFVMVFFYYFAIKKIWRISSKFRKIGIKHF